MRLSIIKNHFAALVVLTSLVLTGCQSLHDRSDSSLYLELGARAGIAAVVEDLLYLIVDDKRISSQFKGIDVVQFHRNRSGYVDPSISINSEDENAGLGTCQPHMDTLLVVNLHLTDSQPHVAWES